MKADRVEVKGKLVLDRYRDSVILYFENEKGVFTYIAQFDKSGLLLGTRLTSANRLINAITRSQQVPQVVPNLTVLENVL